MLTRIYIDNFKGLVDFELKDLGAINLFLGENGAGKSTVFEALQLIRKFVGGETITFKFEGYNTLTRWREKTKQTFELDILGNNGIYTYSVTFEQNNRHSRSVLYETLSFDQQLLLEIKNAEAKIYKDDFTLDFTYPFQASHSLLNTLPQKADNSHLIWFREQFQQWLIIQPTPSIMEELSKQAEPYLDYEAKNFASWYRHLSQNPDQEQFIIQNLKNYLPWFFGFEFRTVFNDSKLLVVQLAQAQFLFNELSDGQRVLIVLYTLIFATQGQDYILCLDEPENFLALSEIQPWLIQLEEHCETHGLQALLISHHPELIDYLGASSSYWFSYNTNEMEGVKAKRLSEHDPRGVSLSELIARGWLDDETH